MIGPLTIMAAIAADVLGHRGSVAPTRYGALPALAAAPALITVADLVATAGVTALVASMGLEAGVRWKERVWTETWGPESPGWQEFLHEQSEKLAHRGVFIGTDCAWVASVKGITGHVMQKLDDLLADVGGHLDVLTRQTDLAREAARVLGGLASHSPIPNVGVLAIGEAFILNVMAAVDAVLIGLYRNHPTLPRGPAVRAVTETVSDLLRCWGDVTWMVDPGLESAMLGWVSMLVRGITTVAGRIRVLGPKLHYAALMIADAGFGFEVIRRIEAETKREKSGKRDVKSMLLAFQRIVGTQTGSAEAP